MLVSTTTDALKMLRRIVPPMYRAVIDEAINALEWRKAHDPTYVEPRHDA